GAAQPKWLRTTPRRYRPEYSNPKPLERTQNWIKLGGKVTFFRHDGGWVRGGLLRGPQSTPKLNLP
ncbi:hypothetical protein ACA106_16690, partial [Agrobacterium pusense]